MICSIKSQSSYLVRDTVLSTLCVSIYLNLTKHFEIGITIIPILPIRKLLIINKIIINECRQANWLIIFESPIILTNIFYIIKSNNTQCGWKYEDPDSLTHFGESTNCGNLLTASNNLLNAHISFKPWEFLIGTSQKQSTIRMQTWKYKDFYDSVFFGQERLKQCNWLLVK